MTEKYKIYLSASTKNSLITDAELFEFYKKDGTVNLNAFIKQLIVNYFDEYQRENHILRKKLQEALTAKTEIKDQDVEDVIDEIIGIRENSNSGEDSIDESVTITVSGESQNIVNLITENLLRQMGLSEYIRNMIMAYLSMPRSEREKRIFKEEYDRISKAIANHRRITFLTKRGKKKYTVDPYVLATSKQEQNNYLLCFDRTSGKERSFRMSRITSIYELDENCEINEESIEKFKLAEKRGAQFTFASIQESCVYLSEEGKRKYSMIYTNRPTVNRVEGDYYYFEWPLVQLEEYFKRFGKDAVIISPRESNENLKRFYEEANEVYNITCGR